MNPFHALFYFVLRHSTTSQTHISKERMPSVRFKVRANAPFEAMSFSGSAIKASSLKEHILTHPFFKRKIGVEYDIQLQDADTSRIYEIDALIPADVHLLVKKVSKRRLDLIEKNRTAEALTFFLLPIHPSSLFFRNTHI